MGFGNYGICDLWDFGIMGEGGRRGAKQREKGRAIALVHQEVGKIQLAEISEEQERASRDRSSEGERKGKQEERRE